MTTKGDPRKYCFLHLPDPYKNATSGFDRCIAKRILDGHLNFQGVFFPEVFISTTARHGPIEMEMDFKFATFNREALFFNEFRKNLNLAYCEFKNGAQFSSAIIHSNLLFYYSTLNGYFSFGDLDLPEGSGISFNLATTSETSTIRFGSLKKFGGKISFDACTIGGSLRFDATFDSRSKEESQLLSMNDAIIEHPARVRFRDCVLDPDWFLNVDSRKFSFSNIEWKHAKKPNPSPHARTTYRHLAENCEENSRYDDASKFRRSAMESEWLEKKQKTTKWINNLVLENEKLKRRFGGSTENADKPIQPINSLGILRRSGDLIIHGLYRITSAYGESWTLAASVLAATIFFVFPIIYSQIDFQVSPRNIPLAIVEKKDCTEVVITALANDCVVENRRLDFLTEAISQSLATATLQTIEYRVPSNWGSVWMILEKIFAPVQAALLALAIRRKFMR